MIHPVSLKEKARSDEEENILGKNMNYG